jgi:hypothetical protein
MLIQAPVFAQTSRPAPAAANWTNEEEFQLGDGKTFKAERRRLAEDDTYVRWQRMVYATSRGKGVLDHVIEHRFSVVQQDGSELVVDYLVDRRTRESPTGYRIDTALLVGDGELFVVYDDFSSAINIVWYKIENGKVRRLTGENSFFTIRLPQSIYTSQYKVTSVLAERGNENWVPLTVDVMAPSLVIRYKVNMVRTPDGQVIVDVGDYYPLSAKDQSGRWVNLRRPNDVNP